MSRNEIVEQLNYIEMENDLIKAIIQLYEDEVVDSYANNNHIGSYQKNIGIRQGCMMSPIIFILVMDMIIKKLNITWTNKDANIQMYADDGLLIANSEYEMDEKLRMVVIESSNSVGI